MKSCHFSFLRQTGARARGVALAALILALPAFSHAAGEQQFNSPAAAVKALTDAAKAGDTNAIHTIFGPEGHELISPDVVQATEGFKLFAKRLVERTTIVHQSDTKVEVDIGEDGWPFPIPLVKQGETWFFDVAAGREEILNRRIGADELGAIDVCHAYVDAQREYSGRDHSGKGILEYAQHLMSTKETHDGLYWPAHGADELSPLGPLVAQARGEGYHHKTGLLAEDQTPYHGYYFRILTKQGKHAPIGKYDYVINGHMIGGFALIAWPAEWGNTGVMTFIVNQQGKVYQKDLGPKTESKAKCITSFDPDSTWVPAVGK